MIHRFLSLDEDLVSLTSEIFAVLLVLPECPTIGLSLDSMTTLCFMSSGNSFHTDSEDFMTSYKLTRSDTRLQQAKFTISSSAIEIPQVTCIIMQLER